MKAAQGKDWRRYESTLAVLGLMLFLLGAITWKPSVEPAVTDLGRNVLAVQAQGERNVPVYTQLSTLDPSLAPEVGEWWVAQSPLAVAAAAAPARFGGIDGDEYRPIATILIFISGVIFALSLPRSRRWVVPWLLGATVISAGWDSELTWHNGQAITAVALAVFLLANATGRELLASVVLGATIAWRPWLAPLAFFQIANGELAKRLLVSGVSAGVITLVATKFLGGLSVLGGFLHANAANIAQYRRFEWNLSLTTSLSLAGAYVVLALSVALVMWLVQKGNRVTADIMSVVTIGGFMVMVWSHYWIPLVFVFVAVDGLKDYFVPAAVIGVILIATGVVVTPLGHVALYGTLVAVLVLSAFDARRSMVQDVRW